MLVVRKTCTRLKKVSPTSSDGVISKSLCREPDPCTIQKFANGSPLDSAAGKVARWGERKGRCKVFWRCRGVIRRTGLKIHPPLVCRVSTWACEWCVAWTGSLILPELALQYLNFINQLGELVVGGDWASFGDAGFRNPTEKEELPKSHMRGHEQGNQQALQVSGSREPVLEEALRWT